MNQLLLLLSLMKRRNNIYKKDSIVSDNNIVCGQGLDKETVQVIVNCQETEKTKEEFRKIGKIKYELPMINSYVLEVSRGNINRLEGIEGVVKIEQDTHLTAQVDVARGTVNAEWKIFDSALGEDVGVAVLDTGIYPHLDLVGNTDRIIAFKDFVNNRENPYDDNGHGTHVAGIIGGDGFESNGRYMGIAPKCNLIGIKVLNKDGNGNISDVLAGIQWIIDNREKYNIKVINLSVGMKDIEGEEAALVKAVNIAWDQNIVVICAAGNNGPGRNSITTPGVSRKVITVGSSDDAETVSILGDFISDYSSRGPTKECIKKPDIVAPGSNISSCNCNKEYYSDSKGYPEKEVGYIKKSGTSMATPVVSGIIARLLSDYPNITNKDIKLGLKYSANDLGFDQEHQGWGLIDLKRLYQYIDNINNNINNENTN